MVRFSPGCKCCDDRLLCTLCALNPFQGTPHLTTQNEYDLTFWPGAAEETVITVQGPVSSPPFTPGTPNYGCCNWIYEGVVDDVPGLLNPAQPGPDCSGQAALSVALQLCWDEDNINPPPGQIGRWYWRVRTIIQCDPPTQRTQGQAVFSLEMTPDPGGLSVNCDFDTYTPDPFIVCQLLTTASFNDCTNQIFPHDPPCINCDQPDFGGGPYQCYFPSNQVKVENAQGGP